MRAAGMIVPAWTTKGDAGFVRSIGTGGAAIDGGVDESKFAILPVLSERFVRDDAAFAGVSLDAVVAANGRTFVDGKYFAGACCLSLLVHALLFGINRKRTGLSLCRDNRTAKIARQGRSEPRHIAGNPGIVLWQADEPICHIVVIGREKFVRSWTALLIALQSPKHRAGDESESQSGATSQNFAGERVSPAAVPGATAEYCAMSS